MEYLVRILDTVSNGYRFYVMGELNGFVVDGAKGNIASIFRIPGENKNERRIVDFVPKRAMFVSISIIKMFIRALGWLEYETEWKL